MTSFLRLGKIDAGEFLEKKSIFFSYYYFLFSLGK
jgi:hypothetical protein